jgi:peptide/nickel transport system substrate-binding protein
MDAPTGLQNGPEAADRSEQMGLRNHFVRSALALALSACPVLAACGGGGSDTASGAGREGGSVTIAQSAQPDYLDPALSYTLNSWEPMWLVYTPPLTYRHAEGEAGTQLIPGVATALPKVTNGGKTYELTLRKGLKYSDGSRVKASDFEHSIKRVLNLESGGSFFFQGIEGATKYVEDAKPDADIPGIETDDETGRITINLDSPDGTFSNVLAMGFSAPVPGNTPFKNLSADPPVGVGAYAFAKSVPNREFVLRRVRGFDLPGIPAGKIDTITTKIVKSLARQAQDVIRGDLDYMQDPPPADLKPVIKSKYADRYSETPTINTYYFFLNNRVPPFDDEKVREAVNYGVDKPALARLFAGEMASGCSYLPPAIPGSDPGLDGKDCPWGDPNEAPDLERARRLVDEAGAKGAKVAVWGNTDEPGPQITEAYVDMLRKIGLDAKAKIVDGGVYYAVIGNARTKAQTGFANFFQDFPHPRNFMNAVDGRSIQATNNPNYGNIDDPVITKGIERLGQEPKLTDEVAGEWGKLNQRLTDRALMVVYGHRKLATFLSERMDFENCALFHQVNGNDYSSWCLK